MSVTVRSPERRTAEGRQTLSVLVLARNEAHRIAACLERVAWADELLVVDDLSTDATFEISRRCGASVAQRRFDTFANQANFGLDRLSGDWVLSLDADELVSPELTASIQAALRQPSDYVGFTFKRCNFFLGHRMRYGGWYHDAFHLFKRSAGRFVGDVHYAPQVSGPIGHLVGDVEHYPFQSLEQFVERQNRYTTMEAQAFRREHPRLPARRLRGRLCVRPIKLFRKSYVKKAGRREGMHGLVFGLLFAWVEFLKWAKYWALGLPKERETAPARAVSDGRAASAPRARLSVVVLTKNEERQIARCLESAQWADEMIVVDGESADRTADICRSYGAAVISHPFSGDFGQERNIGNEAASGDWILQLDADDRVSDELRAQIEIILREDPPYAAYKFRRKNWFLGREMRYGGWYHYYPHLFRRGRAHFEGRVHHLLRTDGPMGTLEGALEHHPFESLEQFIAKHNRYTSIEAQELLERQGVPELRLVREQLCRKPLKLFWKTYVKKQGFREGWHGFVFSVLFAWVHFLKWAKYWELCQRQGGRLG